MDSKKLLNLALFLGFGCYLPVILIWTGIIPFEFRFHLLVIMTLVMIAHSILKKRTLAELGFRLDTLRDSLIWNGTLSLALVAIMYIAYINKLIREPTVPDWDLFYVFYVFISSPAQEFIFRSKVFSEMNHNGVKNPATQVLLSAVTYCFLHVIYNDLITLAVTMLMGMIWGFIYYKRPNFWGVTISHAVLGVVSIATGLI